MPFVLFLQLLQLVQLLPLPVAPPHKYPDSVSAAPRSQREAINSSSNTYSGGASLQGRWRGQGGVVRRWVQRQRNPSTRLFPAARDSYTPADHTIGAGKLSHTQVTTRTAHLSGGRWPHGLQLPTLPLSQCLGATRAASRKKRSPDTSCAASSSSSGTETPRRAAAATTAGPRQTTARGSNAAAAAPPLAAEAESGGNLQKRAEGMGGLEGAGWESCNGKQGETD